MPIRAWPVIPQHIHEILSAVVVMKERGIEPAAVEEDGIRPAAVDARAGDEEVVEVAQRSPGGAAHGGAPVALHVGVDQVEKLPVMAEARRPDAATVGIAAHVELAGAVERAR